MSRLFGLVLVMCLIGQASASTEAGPACAPMSVADSPVRTFVVLIGYPEAPGGDARQRLEAVDDDVGQMITFFEALAPEAVRVHLRPGVRVRGRHKAVEFHPPTWRAVLESVEHVRGLIAASDRPARVYVYYAGHGQRRVRDGRYRTHIFLDRETASGERPGYDGVVSSAELSDHVLEPLGEIADVHLIVDACQSYYLIARELEALTERTRKIPPRFKDGFVNDFARAHPRVGVFLATNGDAATYEHPRYGGLFSAALRSAAVAHGDLDGDGRLTYGEMGRAIKAILAKSPGTGEPGIFGPDLDSEAVFIDYRTEPGAARICLAGDTGRVEIADAGLTSHAVLHPAGPLVAHLPRGRTYHLADASERMYRFEPADGPLSAQLTPIKGRMIRREVPFEAKPTEQVLLPEPIRVYDDAVFEPPPWSSPSYWQFGVGLGGSWLPDGGPGEVHLRPEAVGWATFGWERWSVPVEVGYQHWRSDRASGFDFRVNGLMARSGVALTLAQTPIEWSVAGLAGGALLIQNIAEERRIAFAGDALVGPTVRLPFGRGRPAIRLDLRAGAQFTEADGGMAADFAATFVVGWEYESSGE